jgi:hypothetical protein
VLSEPDLDLQYNNMGVSKCFWNKHCTAHLINSVTYMQYSRERGHEASSPS